MNQNFWSKTKQMDSGCVEWIASGLPTGYGQFKVPGTRMNIVAHRWAWQEKHGPIPKGLFVCHRCDNPKCVNVDHLFLGTPKDNVDDMIAKGRKVNAPSPGEQNGKAKLTEEDVNDIRTFRHHFSIRQLAMHFGVGSSQIHRIVKGLAWN
jgi:hypothetical protein